MSLRGKNVIVTGATSGFGVEIAAVLSRQGANVFIGGRRADKGAKVAKETKTTFHTVDVATQSSNESFFNAAEEHFGGPQTVDYIFLNAGVEGEHEKTMAASNLDIDTYDYIYNVNVRGVVLGLKYGTPLLRAGGKVLATSSVASILPFATNPIYASSKAAVDSLIKSYAAQFAESDDERITSLSVLAFNPVFFQTEMGDRFTKDDESMKAMFAKMVNPSQRVGTAQELAHTMLDFSLDKLPYKSGETFAVDADTHFPLSDYFGRMAIAQRSNQNDKWSEEKVEV